MKQFGFPWQWPLFAMFGTFALVHVAMLAVLVTWLWWWATDSFPSPG